MLCVEIKAYWNWHNVHNVIICGFNDLKMGYMCDIDCTPKWTWKTTIFMGLKCLFFEG